MAAVAAVAHQAGIRVAIRPTTSAREQDGQDVTPRDSGRMNRLERRSSATAA